MRYNIYLGQIEKAHTKRKLAKLLDLIGSDFEGISGRQYESLRFLIISKMYAQKKGCGKYHNPKDVKNADILNVLSISRFFRESKFFKLKLGHAVKLAFYNFIQDINEKYGDYAIFHIQNGGFSVDEENRFRSLLGIWTDTKIK